MELALWTYEGPPHVGAMRIATSMRDVHYVIHAPQGDTYADLLFTMIERHKRRPPVTYTTFQARDLGGDTADLLKRTIAEAYERYKPNALMVGESCTAELIQDQPGSLARGMNIPVPVVPLELPSYSKKENWGASESLYYLVRHVLAAVPEGDRVEPRNQAPDETSSRRPLANVLGPTSLGFRCRDDAVEICKLLEDLGVEVNVVAPLDATTADLKRIPAADFNICLYPEIARTLCKWLEKTCGQPTINTVPIGVGATLAFIAEIEALTGIDGSVMKDAGLSRLPWYSRSVDSTYLTGKRVCIFGDGTHVIAAARIARDELGFEVVGLGTFSREMARDLKAVAAEFGIEPLITDDYLDIEAAIAELQPELVLGTQMERHMAKRLGIPCAVISSPVHVQDFPARYSPQMGFEGANVIFDTWVHPLTMGLEEHLLHMFRDDFEFNDSAAPSHLHGEGVAPPVSDTHVDIPAGKNAIAFTSEAAANSASAGAASAGAASAGAATARAASVGAGPDAQDPVEVLTRWNGDAEAELKKIPFFVRGKARRNTEAYARELGQSEITIDTLYEAKAHYGR